MVDFFPITLFLARLFMLPPRVDARPSHSSPRSSRKFNQIKQANDYDKGDEYVRTWVPELKDVSEAFVQTPWREFSLSVRVGVEADSS